jgi:branched-chain amino acid transport system substrate-binding protein
MSGNSYRATSVLAPCLALVLVASACSSSRRIPLGALLTNPRTTDPDTHAALQLALRDFNGSTPERRATLEVADTSGSVKEAQAALERFAKRGIRVVIGPETSEEAQALLPISASLGITLLSHCSSAPSLAVNDHLFRMVPDDRHQARMLAARIHRDGFRALIPLWLAGTWGDDFEKALRDSFTRLEGAVSPGLRYEAATSAESALERVEEQLKKLRGKKAAVVFLMFGDQLPGFFAAAADRPALRRIRWYGTDGTALARSILDVPKAARFAIETRFLAPLPTAPPTAERARLEQEIVQAVPGSVHACAFAAYDALMIAARAASSEGAIAAELRKAAADYTGVTGRTSLNEAGDRIEGSYAFWGIAEADGSFGWHRRD